MPWFSVRSHYRFIGEFDQNIYEERVVLFEAADADDAIAQAQVEGAEYSVDGSACEVLDLFQSFLLFEDPGAGKEIFSLMRENSLGPGDYLDRFFDTGTERTQVAGSEGGQETCAQNDGGS